MIEMGEWLSICLSLCLSLSVALSSPPINALNVRTELESYPIQYNLVYLHYSTSHVRLSLSHWQAALAGVHEQPCGSISNRHFARPASHP